MGSKNRHHRQFRRVFFRVPVEDSTTLEWLDFQTNMSISIRMAIREYITRHGISDPTCLPVEQGARRGRPPKSESEKVDRQIDLPTTPPPTTTEPEVEKVASDFDSHTSLPSRDSEMGEPEKPISPSHNVPDPIDVLGAWH